MKNPFELRRNVIRLTAYEVFGYAPLDGILAPLVAVIFHDGLLYRLLGKEEDVTTFIECSALEYTRFAQWKEMLEQLA